MKESCYVFGIELLFASYATVASIIEANFSGKTATAYSNIEDTVPTRISITLPL